jgi:para-aminobenzoate synthetase component 1
VHPVASSDLACDVAVDGPSRKAGKSVSDWVATTTPHVVELTPPPRPEEVFQRLAGLPHVLFLDSALRLPRLGRYSFVTADPFDFLELPADGRDALAVLAGRMSELVVESRPELPPFQGGAAGLFSYDLGLSLERIPRPRHDEFQVPAMAVGLYDVVIAFDHSTEKALLISQGFPETDPVLRRRRARRRARQFLDHLRAPLNNGQPAVEFREDGERLAPEQLAPQFPVPDLPLLTSNFSAPSYLQAVKKAVDYVWAGDVFQVNLAQRLLYPQHEAPACLYLRLRSRNPAPFSGYFDLGSHQIASASPERFLAIRGRDVETRPIKGTRPRTSRPEADLFAADELQASEKDVAENVMIVDLLRNDLSRVCRPESVRVTQLCEVENFAFVQHLVSAVRGQLDDGRSAIDVIRATFPGGSVTGAPKVRAMEIIAEMEPTARGAYCGCLGYIGFDGNLDLSILIRTITVGRGWLQMPVGGGIVAQSDPHREYLETWHKAAGLLRALPDEA